MKIHSINSCTVINKNSSQKTSFKGVGGEVVSEGFREIVSETLPFYKGVRFLSKVGEGDSRGAVKQGVGVVDNIICQPAKQAAAVSVATKAAAIGTAIFPGIGTAIGAGVGYIGTLLCWGKVRNTVVDAFLD